MNIQAETLITLVQERPVLWDMTEDVYKDKNLKLAAWREVCLILKPNFDKLDEKERKQYGKQVSTKWNNIRDSWLKTVKKQKDEPKSGSSAKKTRNYLYHEQIMFLKKGSEPRPPHENLDYICKEGGRCVVDVSRRNQCQACRFSKCLRVNMKKEAVQHERARRPALTAQHQFSLQKMGYNFARHPNLFHSAPLTVSTFPSVHPYNPVTSTDARNPNCFLENSFHEFSRFPDSLPPDIQLSPLLSTQVGSLHSLNPFKIPLFPTSLHYPMHGGYFPSNIFYPPVASDNSTLHLETRTNRPIIDRVVSPKFHQRLQAETAKPDSQLPDKIKEDEVSSSEEAHKTDSPAREVKTDPMSEMRSTNNYEPPAYYVKKNMDKLVHNLDSAKSRTFRHTSEREKTIQQAESTKCFDDKLQPEHKNNGSLLCEGVYDPSTRLLVATVKWLHSVITFQEMKAHDQNLLLFSNWRELFVLTAAQYSFYFDEEHMATDVLEKQPSMKEELKKLITLLNKIAKCRLDRTEFECLKSALLFRTDSLDFPASNRIEILQDQTLLTLQKHCSAKDANRLARLMLLLPSVCCIACQGLLEHMLFPSTSEDEIHATLSRILIYTSI
ncbi:unnamed protein product [Parnassius apollo]|uniref:(apollo) hypothetical protein n=1 Tax=Parnassius apollo TaxID=110799 RepID=A0A8S3X8J6_PARAO|nr:unnamed protein product [Parnassius apollo]